MDDLALAGKDRDLVATTRPHERDDPVLTGVNRVDQLGPCTLDRRVSRPGACHLASDHPHRSPERRLAQETPTIDRFHGPPPSGTPPTGAASRRPAAQPTGGLAPRPDVEAAELKPRVYPLGGPLNTRPVHARDLGFRSKGHQPAVVGRAQRLARVTIQAPE